MPLMGVLEPTSVTLIHDVPAPDTPSSVMMLVADAYQPDAEARSSDGSIEPLLRYRERFLLPGLNVADAAKLFEKAESEELAVVDNLGNRKVIGLLTEKYLLRRYAEELDKGLKDVTG